MYNVVRHDVWRPEAEILIEIAGFSKGSTVVAYYERVQEPEGKRAFPILPEVVNNFPVWKGNECVETSSATCYLCGNCDVAWLNLETGNVNTALRGRGKSDLHTNIKRAIFPKASGYLVTSFSEYTERFCVKVDDPEVIDTTFTIIDTVWDNATPKKYTVLKNTTCYIFVAKGAILLNNEHINETEFGKVETIATPKQVDIEYLEPDTVVCIIERTPI